MKQFFTDHIGLLWTRTVFISSSFPVIHKVGNIGIFVLLKFENKSDREIS